MDIESLATTAVKNSISWTDCLVPYIPEKDGNPIWDGSIHVYSSSDKRNENDMGRVPTQVKGKKVDGFKASEWYDVPVCELKSYLSEGGVIFFVVELSENTEKTKIFYNSLLPYDLVKLIESAGQQISKRIALIPFPEKRESKIDIFANFISARKKQLPTSSIERIIPLEEFIKQGYPRNLSFDYTSCHPEKDILQHFIDNDVYVYFKIPLGVSYPLGHLTNIQMVKMKVEEPISCLGKQYYSYYCRSRENNISELSFGKAFRFTASDDNPNTMTLKINLAGALRQRIKDCEFVIAVLQENGFYIGNNFIPINSSALDSSTIDTWQDKLVFLKSIKASLDFMGVIEDLDCDTLSDEDVKKIQYLLIPAASGKSVSVGPYLTPYQPATLTIANINILVLAIKQDDGGYLLKNFFTENSYLAFQTENGEMIPDSCYSMLTKNDFIRYSNIDYKYIISNMKMDMPHPLYCEKVNQVVLNLLSAYDETSRSEFLQTAKELTEWLCSIEQDDIVYKLNLLQIIKRERDLSKEEIKWLLDLIDKCDVMNELKMGAYILLEEYDNALRCYDGLSQERKCEYDKFPIMALWKQ